MKYLFIVFLAVLMISCVDKSKKSDSSVNTTYTCSMHPEIREAEPGKCPICHMDLIPVTGNRSTQQDEIELTEQQIKLGNIKVDTIGNASIASSVLVSGVLSVNQTNNSAVSARLAGRIEKLYFKNMNDFVPKGAKLYDLYSEELNNAKQDYKSLLEKKVALGNSIIDFKSLIQSAESKLSAWGMTKRQIRNLSYTKETNALTSFYSIEEGYITALNTSEGAYVTAGNTIMELADLNTLWVGIKLSTNQLSTIDRNADIVVTFPDLSVPGIKTKIDFRYPELSGDSKIILYRASISNSRKILKPGMDAQVRINTSTSQSLMLPADAVLRTAGRDKIWLRTSKGTFTSRVVQTGIEADGQVEIKAGLKIGEAVVVSGVYLMNSEYIFKKGLNN
jgi:Cu(I)/Ag(I) efflux system membrane fusion protein